MNWTKTELFRLTSAERIAESKVRTQRNAQRKFLLSDWPSPNQKHHFIFWIKFGLSLKFGLSERLSEGLIQKVKSSNVLHCLSRYKHKKQLGKQEAELSLRGHAALCQDLWHQKTRFLRLLCRRHVERRSTVKAVHMVDNNIPVALHAALSRAMARKFLCK